MWQLYKWPTAAARSNTGVESSDPSRDRDVSVLKAWALCCVGRTLVRGPPHSKVKVTHNMPQEVHTRRGGTALPHLQR
jgi:hypothetical protein